MCCIVYALLNTDLDGLKVVLSRVGGMGKGKLYFLPITDRVGYVR